jgi:hypothetical protein
MQTSFPIHAPVVTGRLRTRIVLLAVTVVVFFLDACAVQRPFHFRAATVTKVTYDPNRCSEMPDGKFKCKDVVFTVATVEPAK